MKKLIIIMVFLLGFGCATKEVTNQLIQEKVKIQPIPENTVNQSVPWADIEEKYGKLLQEGFKKLTSRLTKESIDKYFNPIIDAYNTYYGNNGKRVYCSRGKAETLFYLLNAADKKEEAIVISQLWADAFYLKGYASIDLGRLEDARESVENALELSPSNSMYLSELGHIYQLERKWNEAMELYKKAEESANEYSPDNLKNEELTRAMRGVGYCLIELGRFDEAVREYEKCLEINKDDIKALNELKYIRSLRNKS